jgi:uncharacterized LabA/DUF88 family protein
MNNVILIVDQHQRFSEARRLGLPLDAEYEAQTLRLLIKPMGREYRCIALISRDDLDGLNAYQRANYEIITYNGDRSQRIREFLIEIAKRIEETPPGHLVLVTADPVFQILCDRASRREDLSLSLWTTTQEIPAELCHPAYNARPLDEILPNSRPHRVDVRVDFENLYYGMQENNWSLNIRSIVHSIKAAVSDLGEIVRIVAYADWGVLAKQSNKELQRDLEVLGVKTRYQISIKGKNSADMEIVDDVYRLLGRDYTEEAVDVIVIGTCDRDFRPVLETAQSRGKRIVVLGLQGKLSRELETVAHEIRYMDQYYPLPELVTWMTSRIRYCLLNKNMPYVDTHYLVKGMIKDARLQELGISPDWETAEQWLGMAGKTNEIVIRQQQHPDNPMKYITTYWIPDPITKISRNKNVFHRSFSNQLHLTTA